MTRITDAEIRAYRRVHPESIDMLMVAIHGTDQELRRMSRAWFAGQIKRGK